MDIALGFEPTPLPMRCENSPVLQALRWSLSECVTVDHSELPQSMEFWSVHKAIIYAKLVT